MTAGRSFWVLVFLAVAVAELSTGDEMINGTLTQGNDTLALRHLPQGNDNIEVGNKTTNTAVVKNIKNRYNGGGGGSGGGGSGHGGGGGGGGSYGWGWGGGGGGGGSGGGWGGGGGGGGYYKWGCGGHTKRGRGREWRGINNQLHRKRVYTKDYKVGEFAQCMNRGRCRGLRLDCPLRCGGPCFCDCQYMLQSSLSTAMNALIS